MDRDLFKLLLLLSLLNLYIAGRGWALGGFILF